MSAHAPSPTEVRHAWDGVAEGFDQFITSHNIEFGQQVLERLGLGPGHRVLDVGAGSGALSIPAARTGADVVAVDISPKMIERLAVRGRAEGLTNLHGQTGNGEALEFGDDTFDAAVSMNGVSLFPDLAGGLRELARVTRPGGRVLIVTFGPLERAEFIAFSLGALRAVVPGAGPPPGPMPPFRLADPGTLQAALEESGVGEVRVDTVTWALNVDSADHLLDTVLVSNPIARQLTAGLTEEQFGQVRQVLDGMIRERSGGEPGTVLHAEMRVGYGAV